MRLAIGGECGRGCSRGRVWFVERRTSGCSADGDPKIQHVIVIMQENRSFDEYFGTFPGADGIAMAHGVPTVCVPDPARDGRRLDTAKDGRSDHRPTVPENAEILGDLASDFDFTQAPRPPEGRVRSSSLPARSLRRARVVVELPRDNEATFHSASPAIMYRRGSSSDTSQTRTSSLTSGWSRCLGGRCTNLLGRASRCRHRLIEVRATIRPTRRDGHRCLSTRRLSTGVRDFCTSAWQGDQSCGNHCATRTTRCLCAG
jgi:hypothetical protein